METATSGLGISLGSVLHGILGMFTLLLIAYLFSTNRRKINWKQVGIGLTLQILLALGILYVAPIRYLFEIVGKFFVVVIDFTQAGSGFLLGGLLNIESYGFIFAFQVLPTIIFFSALTSLLFYLGVIQKVVWGLAWLLTKTMRLSGPESLAVAGNIFLGQTESPLLIKEYLERMNRSEIMLVMTAGMATIAGGVLAAYVGFLGGDDPVQRLTFAKHLLAASVMAAPGAVVLSKILMPQTEDFDTNLVVSKEKVGKNILDAVANGTTDGVKLAVNVGAMLLVFIAFIAMFNYIVGSFDALNSWVYKVTDGAYEKCSLPFLLGYTFAPLMWVLGVHPEDITLVGRVVGEKLILTEFIGYVSLGELKTANAFASPKSIIMATYMLCGFANFASIGIQIGGIGSLAPGKRVWLSQFGLRALLGGTLASLLSGTLIGAIIS
ncbi:MAG: Na+ dependent nucleoside transporter [Bacteroidales bacterium]|jgi:CNT family concentrative nucleoside transporter|nr:Na+ dependent nucleoside transporter [Bacteroidales bacterium]